MAEENYKTYSEILEEGKGDHKIQPLESLLDFIKKDIKFIEEHAKGMEKNGWKFKDEKSLIACSMNLQNIGDSISIIMKEYPKFVKSNPQVNWDIFESMAEDIWAFEEEVDYVGVIVKNGLDQIKKDIENLNLPENQNAPIPQHELVFYLAGINKEINDIDGCLKRICGDEFQDSLFLDASAMSFQSLGKIVFNIRREYPEFVELNPTDWEGIENIWCVRRDMKKELISDVIKNVYPKIRTDLTDLICITLFGCNKEVMAKEKENVNGF